MHKETNETYTVFQALDYIYNQFKTLEIAEKVGSKSHTISMLKREFRKKVHPSKPERKILVKFGFILIDECRVSKS